MGHLCDIYEISLPLVVFGEALEYLNDEQVSQLESFKEAYTS